MSQSSKRTGLCTLLLVAFRPLAAGAQPREGGETVDAMRIPVEVVTQGSGSRWMVVEVQSVPEPGAFLLTLPTTSGSSSATASR